MSPKADAYAVVTERIIEALEAGTVPVAQALEGDRRRRASLALHRQGVPRDQRTGRSP